jgi:hypothetical protein
MKALRFLRTLPLALLMLSAPLRAEQGSIVTPIAGPMTMASYAALANAALLALQTCNSGSSAPANGPSSLAVHYQCWADTTTNPVLYKTYDGASWVTFGALNTSTHVWTPYRNGAPIAAVATSASAADLTTGTLPAARLPNPSASTLGGVQSKTCSASQWLNDVSTLGVLTCAQPNFTDLAGTASLAQLPAFSGMTAAAAAADADTFPTNQGAGNLKQTLAAIKTWVKAWIVKADVGLGNVDNTSDVTKWGATKTLTNTTFNCGSTGNVCTVRLASDIAGFGTGVATALGVNVGSAGAPVLFNGALGTPSSGIATNLTGTASGLTAGNVTTNANLSGEVTSAGNATTVTNASVIAKVLTAFSAGAGTVSSSDSILTAFQKIVGNVALKADLAGPTFTGVPRAPTASPSNNSTQLATTAYVDTQVAGGVSGVGSFNTLIGAVTTNIVVQKFTASGTYTPTAGMLHAIIECLGGGGSGGGATSGANNGNGGGGGAGSLSRKYVTAADIGASKAVTLGAGGTAPTAGNNPGNAGGDANVGTLCIAKGGSGGAGSVGADNIRPGGAGGVAGTGDVVGTGASGLSGNGMNTISFVGGAGPGASSPWGGGGLPNASVNGAGGAGTGFGSGGAGASSYNSGGNFSGGAGAPGLVIITEYVNL